MSNARSTDTLVRRLTDQDIQGLHLYCACNPDQSLCGLDVTGYPEAPDEEATDCAVCADLAGMDCPNCRE